MIQSKHGIARRVGMWMIALVALSALLLTAFRPKPVLVDIATIARSAMTVTIDEEGRTRVRNVYAVSAPVAGRVFPCAAQSRRSRGERANRHCGHRGNSADVA